MTDDLELLRDYALHNSEEAFATLVARHIDLVYSVALRQVRDAQLAEEVTQVSFIILARKAMSLGPKTILPGWLCRTAHYVGARAVTIRKRRQIREQEAYMQSVINEPESAAWAQIEPLLGSALAELGEKDHDAIVLRYFQNKSLSEVGAAMGGSEDAAKKRVSRALEKLRRSFAKRGVVSTASVIAGAISANSIQGAPAALAKSITAAALTKGAAASGSTLTLIKGALKVMAWTKAKTAVAAGAIAVLSAGTVAVVVTEVRSQTGQVQQLNADAATYPGDWIWELNSQTLERVPPLILLRPTKFPANYVSGDMFGKDRYLAQRRTVKQLIITIYSQKNSAAEVVFEVPLSDDKYDCIVTLPPQTHWWDALESEVNKSFHLVTLPEDRNGKTVYVVKAAK